MMNKKNTLSVILFLLIVIFISGCQQAEQCPVVVSQREGIAILDLRTSYNEVPVGNTIQLDAEIQNRGTAIAENVEISLWAYPGFSVIEGYEETKEIGEMHPPNLDVCSEGDVEIVTWGLKAGCDPRETTLAVSVDYDYESKGWASIFLISSDEAGKADTYKEKGTNVPSAGPIQTKVEPVQTEPVILGDEGNFDIRINFENIGIGTVYGPEGNDKKRTLNVIEEVILSVDGPCEFRGECRGTKADTSESCSDDTTLDTRSACEAVPNCYWEYVYADINDENNKILQNDGTLLWDVSTGEEVVLSSKNKKAIKIAHVKVLDERIDDFIKDFCTITTEAKYHYRVIEATTDKIGITGTRSQVEQCREREEE